jgi:hypothetical protein
MKPSHASHLILFVCQPMARLRSDKDGVPKARCSVVNRCSAETSLG